MHGRGSLPPRRISNALPSASGWARQGMGAAPRPWVVQQVLMLRAGVPVQDATPGPSCVRLCPGSVLCSKPRRSPKNRCCGDALDRYASGLLGGPGKHRGGCCGPKRLPPRATIRVSCVSVVAAGQVPVPSRWRRLALVGKNLRGTRAGCISALAASRPIVPSGDGTSSGPSLTGHPPARGSYSR